MMLLTSTVSFAQKDSIALQREARKLVREGNALYNQNNYGDASVAYKKALEKNSSYKKFLRHLSASFKILKGVFLWCRIRSIIAETRYFCTNNLSFP